MNPEYFLYRPEPAYINLMIGLYFFLLVFACIVSLHRIGAKMAKQEEAEQQALLQKIRSKKY